jgi:hypothetical protein
VPPSLILWGTVGVLVRTPIIDERTGEPVVYPALLQEAMGLAKKTGQTLPSACLDVAEKANHDKAESIARHLRRLRNEGEAVETGPGVAPEPIPGFGVWARDLQDYAQRLENDFNEISDRQKFSAHRMRQFRDRAAKIYELASARLDYLESVGRDRAVEALQPHLFGLGALDPSMDAAGFFDGEVRAMTVILHMTSRVIQGSESALSFLEN